MSEEKPGHDALVKKLTDTLSKLDLSDGYSVVMITLDGDIAVALPFSEDFDGELPVGVKLANAIACAYSEEALRDAFIEAVYKDAEDAMDDEMPSKGDMIH